MVEQEQINSYVIEVIQYNNDVRIFYRELDDSGRILSKEPTSVESDKLHAQAVGLAASMSEKSRTPLPLEESLKNIPIRCQTGER
tara:strand:- start:46 stop:300 length:255 start_codon:yes stop_codon:yes gene_type:complete